MQGNYHTTLALSSSRASQLAYNDVVVAVAATVISDSNGGKSFRLFDTWNFSNIIFDITCFLSFVGKY